MTKKGFVVALILILGAIVWGMLEGLAFVMSPVVTYWGITDAQSAVAKMSSDQIAMGLAINGLLVLIVGGILAVLYLPPIWKKEST